MLIPFGVFSAAGAGGAAAAGAYELISTTILSATATSITFSSLPAGYKHLQIRMRTRGTTDFVTMQLNGDTATNYSWHRLHGDGATVASVATTTTANMYVATSTDTSTAAGVMNGGVVDILDAFNTTTNKTVRGLSGFFGSSTYRNVSLFSGSWRSTAAVTSITLAQGTFQIGTRISLYGIKG